MQDRPHAAELAQAVREFIETEVLPRIDDPRLRFRALVATASENWFFSRKLVEFRQRGELKGEHPEPWRCRLSRG